MKFTIFGGEVTILEKKISEGFENKVDVQENIEILRAIYGIVQSDPDLDDRHYQSLSTKLKSY